MPCPKGPHTHPAELVFTEDGFRYERQVDGTVVVRDSWTGRLLNERQAVDSAYANHPAPRYLARIVEEADHRFVVTTQGSHPSSRRYSTFADLSSAQDYLISWAGRRFRIPHVV